MKIPILSLAVFFSCGLSFGQNLSLSKNYVYSREYLEPVTVETPQARQLQSVMYLDGLGRPEEMIQIKATPLGSDLITPIEYDAFGRQVRDYLPLPQPSTLSGAFVPSPVTSLAESLYGDTHLYREKRLESSPLDRTLEQAEEGTPWSHSSGKTTKYEYLAQELSDNVKRYITTTSFASGISVSTLKIASVTSPETTFYPSGSLYKHKTTDPDGNITYEFKNGLDQTLLIRKIDGSTFSDTYYVYNEYNQLAFVLPPLASEAFKSLPSGATVPIPTLDHLAYEYRYEGRGLLAEKKLPAKGWEYFVYDKHRRLVMSQDGLLGAEKQWLFTKYDAFGRAIYTGIYTSSHAYGSNGRASEQSVLDGFAQNWEKRSASSFTKNGMAVYYSNATAYPTTFSTLLSVSYYDEYPPGSPLRPSTILVSSQQTLNDTPTSYTVNGMSSVRSTKGLVTASYRKNIENDQWSKTYTWYDLKARPIGTQTINHLGGQAKVETELDFSGVVLRSRTSHKRLLASTETVIEERFVYDAQNRLTHHYHKVNNLPEELLAHSAHDELGRLISKKVGQGAVQDVNYTYNVRGWLKGINNTESLGADLFALALRYDAPKSNIYVTGNYNGNISQMDWISKSESSPTLRRYSYQYDGLSRLLGAYYSKPTSALQNTGAYNELLSYDLNGNIKTLSRFGNADSSSGVKIDELLYTYNGNKLTKITDTSGNAAQGYPLGGNAISYDANGNMKDLLDKGISSISYNHLNLPKLITQNTGNTKYVYDVDGIKLQKVFGNVLTDYLDGFQYETRDGVTALQFVSTSEGYFDFTKNAYIYHYVDHLGNIRVSYRKNSAGALEILEENNYYPFGLKHTGYNDESSGLSTYRYKYNGKELQETGMYDFGARMMMPDIGRWGVVDPLAEATPNFSPYAYALNNPIRYVDPTGMIAEDCPDCPKPSYEGQTMMGSDGKNYGAARQYGDGYAFAPTKPLEWLQQTDIEEVTITGKPKAPAAPVEIGTTSSGGYYGSMPLPSPKVEMMSSMWDVVGILFSNMKTENKYAAAALGGLAIVASKGKAADDVLKAESKAAQYSVAYEMKLANTSYPGVYRGAHFLEANKALEKSMLSDATFASSMSKLGVTIPRSPAGSIMGKSPTNWVWHHDIGSGVMQLVPKSQHTIGSSFWNTMHPGGRGGFSIWGK